MQYNQNLRFPTHVLTDFDNDRLFISDTGHNRIIVASLDGEIQTLIGNGIEGMSDGSFETAQFSQPQGLVQLGEILFAADTTNHLIRMIDLEFSNVDTIAGTGFPAGGRVDGGPALEIDLESPWDMTLIGRDLYISMNGRSQIWTYSLDSGVIQAVVGQGVQGFKDGAPEEALLLDPSAIASDEDGVIYFLDTVASAVRCADLTTSHAVWTILGNAKFDSGDIDGAMPEARLRMPQGVTENGGVLYISDTHNHKIRRIGLTTEGVSTIAGVKQKGFRDGNFADARFNEPRGISIAGDKIFVADTKNNAVRVLDVTNQVVTTLNVDF
ncbi:MAG: alkyl hydroperoxide reductase [Dehalococcoidia bacterium]|nr:alkyl hydroperoxide reductase [Dehalococcoidia bacterium]